MHHNRPRVYLAGPEVFLPDALAFGRRKVALAAEAGFEGCFPLDQSLDLAGLPKPVAACRISSANEALMRDCNLLIANMTPFRGVSMDGGTAFEIGFMRALGRPVLGYTNVADDYRVRAEAFRRRAIPVGDSDRSDIEIEDFDLAENLMMEAAIIASGAQVIRTKVAPGREMTDLSGYLACLAEARQLVL